MLMKLSFIGHDDRYAIEQLQMSLFPQYIHQDTGEAVSKLSRGETWLTATTTITINGQKTSATKRLKAAEESVRLRRRILQQSYYLAALPIWGKPPPGVLWPVCGPQNFPPNIFWKAAVPLPPARC